MELPGAMLGKLGHCSAKAGKVLSLPYFPTELADGAVVWYPIFLCSSYFDSVSPYARPSKIESSGIDAIWDKVASEAARTVPGIALRCCYAMSGTDTEYGFISLRFAMRCAVATQREIVSNNARAVGCEAVTQHAMAVAGRENGGNCDIKNLSRGCAVYFPVSSAACLRARCAMRGPDTAHAARDARKRVAS
eukprot:3941925-Rhodomonas_salina.6